MPTFEAASLGNRAGDAAIAKRNGSIDLRVEQHAIALGLRSCGQFHQLANVSTTAGCQDRATRQDANTTFDFANLSLKVAIVVSAQDVAQDFEEECKCS